MPKTIRKRVSSRPKASNPQKRARKSLGELNDWMRTNHAALLKKARTNCVRLTGKPVFGGTGRRKSA